MMVTVPRRQAANGATLFSPELVAQEASTLGFPPGKWPPVLVIVDDDGKEYRFTKAIFPNRDGGFNYESEYGTLVVVND
jgi:hypothetical protein